MYSKATREWLSKQTHNYLLQGIVTFLFPRKFIKNILANNAQYDWPGERPPLTLSFDCDFPEDVEAIPEVLSMLEPYDYKASFACVGYWIEKYPDQHKMIVDHGHEIINHTYSHPDNEILNPDRKFRHCSYEEKKEEIVRCHEICQSILNYEPKGSRLPHFKHNFNKDIYKILKEIGYQFSSSTWLTSTPSSGMPFKDDSGIIEFPVSTCPSHPFTVFDTWHSLNTKRWSHRIKHQGVASYLSLFDELLELGLQTNSYTNVYLDPLDVPKMPDFKDILGKISGDRLEVVTYAEYIDKNLPLYNGT